MPTTASTTTASTVAAMIPIRMAPRTCLTIMTMMASSPRTKTSVGQPARKPPIPSSTGVGPAGLRTKPASTNPMIVMNRPMPTLIAVLSWRGTARKTAARNPVSTSTRMISPSSTTRPIASAQVIPGSLAMPNATKALSPSPVASARGKFATTPMRIVMTPATSAVTAATFGRSGADPPPRNAPVLSVWVPMISGLSTTM